MICDNSNKQIYIVFSEMANPRINIKNIDYFKFKKIVIDGNRDDYAECSKDVKDFCDIVQTVR